jgi:hypothetical protein
VETIVIEEPDPSGSFGAKTVGEPGIIPTAPAIAILHASGASVTTLPMTPERVRAALRAPDARRTRPGKRAAGACLDDYWIGSTRSPAACPVVAWRLSAVQNRKSLVRGRKAAWAASALESCTAANHDPRSPLR